MRYLAPLCLGIGGIFFLSACGKNLEDNASSDSNTSAIGYSESANDPDLRMFVPDANNPQEQCWYQGKLGARSIDELKVLSQHPVDVNVVNLEFSKKANKAKRELGTLGVQAVSHALLATLSCGGTVVGGMASLIFQPLLIPTAKAGLLCAVTLGTTAVRASDVQRNTVNADYLSELAASSDGNKAYLASTSVRYVVPRQAFNTMINIYKQVSRKKVTEGNCKSLTSDDVKKLFEARLENKDLLPSP